MDLAQILVRLGITGDKAVVDGLNKTDVAIKNSSKSAVGAGIAFRSMDMPLVSLASSAMAAQASIGMLAASMSAVMSLNLAAHYQRVNIAFTNMLHSASAAKSTFADLLALGRSTPFETSSLIPAAIPFLNTENANFSTAQKSADLSRIMRAVTDTSAAGGKSTDEMVGLAHELAMLRGMIRMRPNSLDRLQPFMNLQEVAQAGAGKKFSDLKSATQFLESLGSSERVFQTLLTGMEKINGGAAQGSASSSILGLIQNIGETMRDIMLPTANALLPVLGMIGRAFLAAATAVMRLNELTGGAAGLTAIILSLWRAKTLLIGTVRMAKVKIDELTASIARLGAVSAGSAATNAAAGAGGAAAAAGVSASSGAAAVSGIKGIIPWLKNIPVAIKEAGGIMAWMKGGIGAVFGGISKATLGGLLAWGGSVVLGMLGNRVSGKMGGALKGAGEGLGWGSLGFFGGPVIGAITSVIGGLIGGIRGWMTGDDNPQREIANNTQKMSQQLQEMNSHLVGGGRRGQRAASDLQIEMALQRALGPGVV